MKITQALLELYPNSEWHLPDVEDFNTLVWMDKNVEKPTFEQIQAYMSASDYKEKRRAEYPSLGEQLDRLTKTLAFLSSNGVNIGPDGVEQVTEIDAVKTKYPKPEK